MTTSARQRRTFQLPREEPPSPRALDWAVISEYWVSPTEHVNLSETRPVRTAVRQGVERCASGPKRHIVLSDSAVNVGAWGQGALAFAAAQRLFAGRCP